MDEPKPIDEIDVAELQRLLERIKPLVSAPDYALLDRLAKSLVWLTRLLRTRGTTIARLRRMAGFTNNEKTANVLPPQAPKDGSPADGSGLEDPPDPGGAQGGGSTTDEVTASAGNEPHGDDGSATKPASERSQVKPETERPKAKGHGRVPASAYPDARQIEIPHESLCLGDTCPACLHGTLYELDKPAQFLRIVGQPPLVGVCWNCQRLRCSGCGMVFTARAPEAAQGSKYTESAVSMMALQRFGVGVPHHRLDRLQGHLKTPVPASTQWDVLDERVEDLRPAHNEFKRQAAQGAVLHNDDTRVLILALLGKRRAVLVERGELPNQERTGLFTTGVVSVVGEGRHIALFFSGRQHAGENLADLLEHRATDIGPPILMSDALPCNLPKGRSVIDCNCLAHGRRRFVDEAANYPTECQFVLERIGQVFKVDDLCRQYKLSDEQRLRLHQRKSAPVMDEIEAWMRAQFDEKRIEPNSGMGGAINYMLKRWNKLTLFLRVPGAPLTNNICERALKAAIRHRNNSLFYRTKHGAEVGDIYMALIYTAEINGENPFDYLTALLLHARAVAETPAEWMPWNWRDTLSRLANSEAPRSQSRAA